MNSSHLGISFLIFGTLFLMMTPSVSLLKPSLSFKPSKKQSLIAVKPIIQDIISLKRTVLLIANFRSHFLVIVSARGKHLLTEQSLVFAEAYLNNEESLILNGSPVLLGEKWPKTSGRLPKTAVSLLGVYDFIPDSLVFASSGKVHLLNLDTGKLTEPSPNTSSPLYKRLFTASSIFLSMRDRDGTFYHASIGASSKLTLEMVDLYGLPSTNLMEVQVYKPVHHYPCKGRFLEHPSCHLPVKWTITRGFTSAKSVFLFEISSASVIRFNLSALTGKLAGEGYSLIPFASFLAISPPPETRRHYSEALNVFLVYCVLVVGVVTIVYIFKCCCACFCNGSSTSPEVDSKNSKIQDPKEQIQVPKEQIQAPPAGNQADPSSGQANLGFI